MVVLPSFLYQCQRTAETKELVACEPVKWHMVALCFTELL